MGDYTVIERTDADDMMGEYPGEMRMLTFPLATEQVAITWRHMPPDSGGKGSYGHSHTTQEEVIYVISGRLQFKLGDDVVELGKHEAIRVPPQTWRGVWNDAQEDAELIIVSARIDDPSGDGERSDEDFWPL